MVIACIVLNLLNDVSFHDSTRITDIGQLTSTAKELELSDNLFTNNKKDHERIYIENS